MCPDIAPEAIQAQATHRCARARGLENALRDAQARVRGHNLDACNPLGGFTALARGQRFALVGMREVDVGDDGAGAVGERFGGAEVREEGAVAGEDGELGHARGRGRWGEGPGARVLFGVSRGEGEGAEGDAEVEVGEDQLDTY